MKSADSIGEPAPPLRDSFTKFQGRSYQILERFIDGKTDRHQAQRTRARRMLSKVRMRVAMALGPVKWAEELQ
jgi:hypothetical protein